MANTYDTSAYPLGSTSPKVLYNNASNLDDAVNSDADTWIDRPPFGRIRRTWRGMENAFDQFLVSSGYEFIGDYDADGPLTITRPNQIFSKDGEYWRTSATLTLPYTTVNNWVVDQPKFVSVGDAALRQQLSADSGASLVGWKRSPMSQAVSTAAQMLDTTSVNIWEFANLVVTKPTPSDPSTWDWTPAFNALAALNTASGPAPDGKGLSVLLPLGTYRLSSVSWGPRTEIFGAGSVIMPFDPEEVSTHLMQFTAHSRITNVTADADYSMSYDTMFWVRGRHVQMSGCVVWKAATAWTFGDPAWATTPSQGMLGDSENILRSCETIWCITAVKAYGLNTILHMDSCLLYTFKESLPDGDPRKAAWEAQDAITFYSWGALIYLTGGAVANFSGEVPLMRSELQPVSGDPAYKNSFGRFFVSGTHIETGWLWEAGPLGAYPAEDDTTMCLKLEGANGYVSTSASPFITAGGDCLQSIHVSGCNFYGTTRNNLLYALAAKVYVEPGCFTNISIDFFQALHALRVKGYERFCALVATGSIQSLSSSLATLRMEALTLADVWNDFQGAWYDLGTGVFIAQVPMRDVEVEVSLSLTSGTASDTTDIQLLVGGSELYTATVYGNMPTQRFTVPRIGQGQTIEVRVAQYQNRTCNGTAANRMVITGSV